MEYSIENDVLLTDDGMAYLVGGGHRVLDYLKGDISPTDESFKNFRSNIEGRKRFLTERKIPYSHVIFPDKQTVLSDQFPIKPFVRLGESYYKKLGVGAREDILYPADALKCIERPYSELDTHMTDHGSLFVLGEMLAKVGIRAGKPLDRIARCITRQDTGSGDLGNKFDPPLEQTTLRLEADWPLSDYHVYSGFNDGMVDILVNLDAPVQKTVLLFGDSFFRMMLKHLSGVFSKVVFMRTRFMHREIVEMVEPDVVFTGNVERYLSAVTSDDDAIPFFLYPHTRAKIDLRIPMVTHAAYRSILAPRSEQSKRFMDAIRKEQTEGKFAGKYKK